MGPQWPHGLLVASRWCRWGLVSQELTEREVTIPDKGNCHGIFWKRSYNSWNEAIVHFEREVTILLPKNTINLFLRRKFTRAFSGRPSELVRCHGGTSRIVVWKQEWMNMNTHVYKQGEGRNDPRECWLRRVWRNRTKNKRYLPWVQRSWLHSPSTLWLILSEG